jgi:hypothetical protein
MKYTQRNQGSVGGESLPASAKMGPAKTWLPQLLQGILCVSSIWNLKCLYELEFLPSCYRHLNLHCHLISSLCPLSVAQKVHGASQFLVIVGWLTSASCHLDPSLQLTFQVQQCSTPVICWLIVSCNQVSNDSLRSRVGARQTKNRAAVSRSSGWTTEVEQPKARWMVLKNAFCVHFCSLIKIHHGCLLSIAQSSTLVWSSYMTVTSHV